MIRIRALQLLLMLLLTGIVCSTSEEFDSLFRDDMVFAI
jgi:hypothetical protein